MEPISRAWRGEEKLWVVFWIYGLVIPALALGGFALFHSTKATITIFLLFVVLELWWMIASWRCAFNAEWVGWGYIASVVNIPIPIALISAILLGGTFLGPGLLNSDDANQFTTLAQDDATIAANEPDPNKKQCLQTMIEYAHTSGVNAKQYIDQNPQYLGECVQYYRTTLKLALTEEQ